MLRAGTSMCESLEYYLIACHRVIQMNIPDKIMRVAEHIRANQHRYQVARCTYEPNRDLYQALSGERLREIQAMPLERTYKSKYVCADNECRIAYYRNYPEIGFLELCLRGYYGEDWKSSGFFFYPENSYCGWHTNSDRPGERIYLTFSENGDKSFFRFRDPSTGEIVTRHDETGWTINRFRVPRDEPLWHCVGSFTRRISIGFRKASATGMPSGKAL